MISLIFFICTVSGCKTIAADTIFTTVGACDVAAQSTILKNYKDAEKGLMPEHRAIYACVNWGDQL